MTTRTSRCYFKRGKIKTFPPINYEGFVIRFRKNIYEDVKWLVFKDGKGKAKDQGFAKSYKEAIINSKKRIDKRWYR